MFHLPYADQSFDVVIVSNALHIVPHPEKALIEFRRVLKNDGTLIAPTFTHAENSHWGNLQALVLKIAGFPLHSRWTSAAYLAFLQQNGWTVCKVLFCRIPFRLLPTQSVKIERRITMSFLKIQRDPKGFWRQADGHHDEPLPHTPVALWGFTFASCAGRKGTGLRLRRRGEYQTAVEKVSARHRKVAWITPLSASKKIPPSQCRGDPKESLCHLAGQRAAHHFASDWSRCSHRV